MLWRPVKTATSAPSAVFLYRFGSYEVDPTRNELRKFGHRLKLERKPFQVLITLLERSGKTVPRSDLQRVLWDEGVFVDFEKGLRVAVTKLRTALNDSTENPAYIETVAGEGYRFIAAVEQVFAAGPESASAKPNAEVECRTPSTSASTDDQLDQVHPEAVPTSPWRSWLQRRQAASLIAAVVCVFLLAVTILKLSSRTFQGPDRTDRAHDGKIMLVVLPFENLSGDPAQEYLSDGMTEELSTRLGSLNPQQLGVIGRTSAMTYKHSPRTISQIGEELAVSYVLEGSVRRQRSKLRVTAQLVNVSGQTHVWAQDYDRDVRDLLQVEDDLASDIAKEVGISIAMGQPTKSLHIPDPEAHEDYLLGRYYWNKRTPDGWRMGAEHFRRAIEKDPQFAAAYAGLAESVRDTTVKEAKEAATKAVELDPTSGEALSALGWVELYKEWDFVAAEKALKTAVQLDPNYAPAHHTYTVVLGSEGRLQEAIAEEQKAVKLDPLFKIARILLAGLLSDAGQNDRAMEQLNVIFAMDPQYPKAHEGLGSMYLRRGMYKEAIHEFQVSEQNGGDKLLGMIGYAYARSGDKDQAVKILSELQELNKRSASGNVCHDLAWVNIGLGNEDEALAWLEKEYQRHDNDGLTELKVEPIFDPLRSYPRFQDLLRRMKFPS